MADKPCTSASVNPARENARVRLVDKYKDATQKLVIEQQNKVQEMKNRTPLQGLLSTHKRKEDVESRSKTTVQNSGTANVVAAANVPINPFKAMAAVASEWMESMGGIFPYMPGMLPGMGAPFRPSFGGVPRGMVPGAAYRGMPRMRGSYFGRGRGRGGYDPNYGNYRQHTEDAENTHESGAMDGNYYPYHYAGGSRYPRGRRGGYKRGAKDNYYTKKHWHRHHRSHSRSSSYSRSRSRSYDRRHYSKRSRSHSGSRSYYSRSLSSSRSHSRSDKVNRKLVSTRRSRTVSYTSSSRSRSRSHYKRSHHRSSRRRSRHSSEREGTSQPSSRRHHSVVLETDELVRSAEVIKRTIESEVQTRMREEEREIKQSFRPITYSSYHQPQNNDIWNKTEDQKATEAEDNGLNERVDRSRSKSNDSYDNQRRKNSVRSRSRLCSSAEDED